MPIINVDLKHDNCKDCIKNCEHAGTDREFVCSNRVSCKKTAPTKDLQLLYTFVERLKANAHSIVGFNVRKRVYAKEYTINEIDIDKILKEFMK